MGRHPFKSLGEHADEGTRGGSMVSALSAAVSGLRDATLRLDVAANNIANVNTPKFAPSQVVSEQAPGGGVATFVTAGVQGAGAPAHLPAMSGTDLAAGMLNLIVAKIAFAASARVISTAAELDRALFDVLG